MGLTHSKSKKKEKKKYTTIKDVLMCVNRLEQRLMGSEAKSEYYPTMEAQIRAVRLRRFKFNHLIDVFKSQLTPHRSYIIIGV